MGPDPITTTAAHAAYRRGRARMALGHAAPALLYMGLALALGQALARWSERPLRG